MKHYDITPLLAVIIAMVLMSLETAISQSNFWEQVDNSIGAPVSFLFSNTGTIFKAHYNQGVFRSTDQGLTWTSVNDGITDLRTIALAKNAQGEIFAGTGYSGFTKIFHSTDSGDHWDLINFPDSVYDLKCLSVNNNGDIFATVFSSGGSSDAGVLYRSTDNGTTWNRIPLNLSFPNSRTVPPMVINSKGYIFLGERTKGVYVSKDNGNTWTLGLKYRTHFDDGIGWVFCIGPDDEIIASNATSFRVLKTTIFRSMNDGISWRRIIVPSLISRSGFQIRGIAKLPDGKVILAGGNSVYVNDQKQPPRLRWIQEHSGLPDACCEEISAIGLNTNGRVFLGTNSGVYRSVQQFSPLQANTGAGLHESDGPASFSLAQNYPNPFNPTTTIEFELASDALVTVKVYNTIGQEVATLSEHEEFGEGVNELEFDGSNLPSGVYYYRILAQDIETGQVQFTSMKKMLMIK